MASTDGCWASGDPVSARRVAESTLRNSTSRWSHFSIPLSISFSGSLVKSAESSESRVSNSSRSRSAALRATASLPFGQENGDEQSLDDAHAIPEMMRHLCCSKRVGSRKRNSLRGGNLIFVDSPSVQLTPIEDREAWHFNERDVLRRNAAQNLQRHLRRLNPAFVAVHSVSTDGSVANIGNAGAVYRNVCRTGHQNKNID